MAKTKSWEVSDAFWEIAESLIPERKRDPRKEYRRKLGAGRKPMNYNARGLSLSHNGQHHTTTGG